MIDDIRRIAADASNRIAEATDLDHLAELDREVLGKTSELSGFKRQMGSLDHEGKRTVGSALNQAREQVQAAVADLDPGSAVLIMSFSHAEDLDVVAACLERIRRAQDLPFVGLIGSRTKWASFRSRLRARGFSEVELAHVTCPIGLPGIGGKAPAVIAASVVAQLLTLNDRWSAPAKGI